MPYIPPEVVEKAREMDLLTYLKSYEPQELVHFGGNTYYTREHDSLKISNGKWCWFSRGIGGYSALDYLIKVKEMPFTQAVETIMGNVAVSPPAYTPAPKQEKPKVLLLPQASRCATHAVEYLVLVYKCGQKKLNNLYYQMKEQRRCSAWRKTKNPTLRNSSSRSWICTMPVELRIHNWNVNMA